LDHKLYRVKGCMFNKSTRQFGNCGFLKAVAIGLIPILVGVELRADQLPPSASVPDPVSIERYGPAYRYPQAGWIVLHIEGEPYERGYQHGRLLAPEIAEIVQTAAVNQSPKSPEDGWTQMRTLADALFLRRYDQEFLQEMKGIADGAAD
jgi:hypothetical protein